MSAPLRLSAEQRRQLREELQRRGLDAGPEIGPRPDRDGDPPLSFSQERLWFLDQLRPGSATYNIPAAIRLAGPLDPAVLAACFAEIVRRHSTLRTTFPVPAGAEPRQRVAPASPVPLPRVDLAGLPVEIRDRETGRLTAAEASASFHLAAGPLLRSTLLRLAPEEHLLLLTVHHIVADGWSVGLLIREMGILFETFAAGLPSPLAELPIQYADFTVWQRRHVSGAFLESEIAFWSERLRGAPAELALPTDRPRPSVPGESGASRRLRLAAGLAAGVHALARSAGATPFMVLLAAFETLLSRLSGQADLTVGTPVAGRQHSAVEGLIGFFVNTLVLRADLADDPSFSGLLARTRRDTLAAYTHQELPFEKLVTHLQPGRHPGRNPLFQVLFALQNHPWPELRLGSLRISPVEAGSGTAKADLTLTWQESGECFEAALEYSTELFEETTAERLLLWTTRLLEGAVENPAARARELPLLAAAERDALLSIAQGVRPPYPREATIHGLVREQTRRTPEAIAVEMAGERLTYAGLEARAHRLAHRLLALGVRPDDRVGLAVERSADLVAGMLGILVAGGAYVPLDLSYPQERLDWMIEDAGIATIVHRGGWQGSTAVPRVDLGDVALDGESTDAPVTDAAADHLAYVIYTSGSTGRPKGVAVPHRAVVRLLVATDYVHLEPADRVAQISNPAFDAVTFEVWGALLAGALLVGVPREEALSPEALARRLAAGGVTTLFLTTALFNQVARQAPGAFRGVRHLLFGGEAVDAGAVREVLRHGPPERLVHVYGPTETTTFATWHEVTDLPAQAATVPIGQPLANSTAYVTSPGFELAPPGVPGELLLGGDGLARGYHRRPDLTAERFVPHPWSDQPGDRLYRTGDLVCRPAAGGALEFLGRLDQQVKIRGFRIEPGEIEAVLASHPDVAECAVVVLGSSSEDRRLAAWIAPRPGAAPEPAALRTWLTGRLPAYMMPTAFGLLDTLPLNPNGKLDRRALARLQPQSAAARGTDPETPLERQIAAVWSEILGHQRVGRDDDFFALGGHSLLATRVVSRLHKVCGVELPLRRLFEAPTVAGLAEALADALGGSRTAAPPLAPVPRGEGLPLSFAQQRLWFLDRLEPGSAVYNIPAAVRLAGTLDPVALAAALGAVAARHEVLRTTFATGTDRSGEPFQRIAPPSPVPLPLVDLGGLPEARREREAGLLAGAEAARPFDLARGPLLRPALLRLAPAEHVALFTMHHIIADGWSVGVLVRELAALYEAFSQGRTPLLPPLPVQYADFTVWQREWISGRVLERELAWWRERLAGAPTLLELPADRPRPQVQTFRGGRIRASVPADLTRETEHLCRRSGSTLFMALLAAFGALLHRHTAQEDLIVGMPIAGRNRLETEDLIGLFVNTLALRVDAAGDPGYGELQRRVRESLLGAYTHQDLPFEKLVTEMVTERSLAHAPLVQVLLVLQNAPPASLELPGLTLSGIEIEARTAKLDLVLNLTETEHGLAGMWIYNTDLFDAPTVLRLEEHFRTLLAAAVADPGRRLSELPMLTEGERHQLLAGWNDSAVDLPRDLCLPDLFAAQAARTPARLAVSDSREEMSYGELRDRAGRLAVRLLEAGLEPEEPVAVWCERGTDLLAAILGILQAGGAYLPLDPHHPPQRIRQILEQTGSRLVLVSEPFLPDCRRELEGGPKVLLIADLSTERGAGGPFPRVLPGHVAYVLFTSGSTGAPKGVMVEHRGMLNHLQVKIRDLGMGPADRVAQTASQTFDISVWQFLAALLTGGSVHVFPDEVVRDPGRLVAAVREEEITVLETVPSLLSAMLDGPALEAGLPTLRWLMPTGEALPPELCRQWLAAFPGIPLINAYGPTECSDDVTHGVLSQPPPAAAVRVSIGRPVANTRIHLLGRRFEPVPVGVAGELCIGGPQLARGYWGLPDLTADRFVPAPFSEEPGGRLYRTGDLARWRTEGSLEFLGRMDHQVKVRGFRIELGEIEAVLTSYPGVAEATVLARPETGGPRLVAYVTAREGEQLSLPGLRSFLGGRLPEYMVPSGFVPLEEMPRTPNGKLDRRALERLAPEPAAGDGREPVAPRTGLERFLGDLFRQAAGVERIGVHDSFFELGGNSISGAIVINRVQQKLGEIVHVVALFDHPTVAGLAEYLTRDYPEAVARVWGSESLDGLAAAGTAGAGVDTAKAERLRRLLDPAVARQVRLPKNPPAVFLLSPPRSGSTLLRVMLAGHPRLFAPPELELLGFATLAERRAAFSGRDAFLLEGLIRAVVEARGCGAEEARAIIEEAERAELSTQELYRRLQSWLGKRTLVDKTPSYALDPGALRWAEQAFERPLYVHLLRHPAAMVRSFEEARMEQVFFRREHDFSRRELAELTWLVSHQNVVEFLADVPAERQLRLRFEDLVREPVPVLESLCSFLGLDFHPAMAEPYAAPDARMVDGLHAESRMLGDVKFHQHQRIDPDVAERWRREPPLVLDESTCALAADLGYEVDRPRRQTPGLVARVLGSADEPVPLSFSQQRLWFLHQLEPDSPAYNMPLAVRLAGPLDRAALRDGLTEIIRRHEALRTTFCTVPGGSEPVQRISPPLPVALPLLDLGGLPSTLREAEARRLAAADAARPFDLESGPLLRIALLRLAPGEHLALLALHHIAADGWSLGVLAREFGELYVAFSQGRTASLPPLPIQYADFAAWQRQWLAGEVLEGGLAWWRERLAGAPTLLELPADRPRPRVQTFRGDRVRAAVLADLTRETGRLCQRSGATLFMALLAAFGALLHRHTAQEDLLVGIPIAGRNRLEIEGLIGLFINTLALRVDAAGDPGYGELLRRVRESLLGAYAHQEVPFEKLVTELVTERSLAHAPLVQVLLVLQNAPSAPLELPGLTLSGFEAEAKTAKLDLVLNLTETPHGLAGVWIYNTDLFDAPTVLRLQEHFHTLLAAAVADPGRRLSALPMLGEGERHQVLAGWNDSAVELPQVFCFPSLFAAQAARTPSRPAVADACEELSYGELRARAGRLASRLLEAGLEPEEPVAVWCERGVGLLAAILGIFQAGCSYLPLDPHHPPQRIRQILEQTGSRLVLVSEAFLRDCRRELEGGPKVLLLADLLQERAAIHPFQRVLPGHVAYVLFTSGSTGAPKGVMVEHRGMLNHLQVKIRGLGLGPADRVAQTASQTFDISVWQFLAALLAGGSVHVFPDEVVRDPVRLVTEVRERGITVLETVPSLLAALLDGSALAAGLPALRWLMPTGEALPPELCRQWLAAFPGIPLINAYGPTECSDDVTHGVLRESPPTSAVRVPIGRPVANTRIHLLGRRFEPVPVGVAGELCIGGSQLARGYWGRPDLTAERFVPAPVAAEPGERLYRTGDLARWRTEGSLEFLGRIDHQVKVRGFRIELGEIEAVLASHPGLAEAAVLTRSEAGSPRLVAYVTAREGEQLSIPELRSFLGKRLPEYMVPSGFVLLEEMPRTPNGKLDRRALEKLAPEPEAGEGRETVAPRTDLERFLAELFQQATGLEQVGIHDSFFELGGNSISGAVVINRVQQRLGEIVHVVALFDHPTVAGLAHYLTRDYPKVAERWRRDMPVRVQSEGPAPLTFSQRRLWFLHQLEPDSSAYNMQLPVRLTGPLHRAALQATLTEIVRRHEVLRTTFVAGGSEPVQWIAPPGPVALPLVNLGGLPDALREAEARRLAAAAAVRPFNLERGPLLRAALLCLQETEHLLLLALHHIVGDGWSMGVLTREVAALYPACVAVAPSPLPPLPVQYADYAIWQRNRLSAVELEERLRFWRGRLAEAPAVLALPTDLPRSALPSGRAGRTPVCWSAELASGLAAVGQRQGCTLFMVLLAGWSALLGRWADQDDLLVGTAVANRQVPEIENLIGFFANTLVLRATLGSEEPDGPSFAGLLARTRQEVLEAYRHQDLPFEKLVEDLAPERSLAHAPLVQVMLVLQGVPGGELVLPGLEIAPFEGSAGLELAAKFDLTLSLAERGGEIGGLLDFRRDLFEQVSAERLVRHLGNLLAAAVSNPGLPLYALPLMSESECREALCSGHPAAREIPLHRSIHDLFAEQAARTPDRAALTGPEDVLTYAGLDARANRLARRLVAVGVGSETLVGIALPRSADLVVALLAVLKAGGAYVPLDPDHPPARLAALLGGLGVPVLLGTERWLADLAPGLGARTLSWESERQVFAGGSSEPVKSPADGGRLAYVLFTSGSTGTPKAVGVEHRAVVRLVRGADYADLSAGQVFLQLAPAAFDASTLEIWAPLLNGGRLSLAPPGVPSLGELGKTLESQGVTTLWLSAGLFHQVVESCPGILRGVSQLLAGGDVLAPEAVNSVLAHLPGCRLVNGYGPTENTTFTCCHTVDAPIPPGKTVPVGRPVAGTFVRVLDRRLRLVPDGYPGELYTGGDGLARGYLGRPDLTAERFVPDPLAGEAGARLYRTGDRVRRRPDGAIEFLGRFDQQVKIRGFRVEPEEVEAAVARHPGVRAAAVLAREAAPGDRRLVAYVEMPGPAPLTFRELRAFLTDLLPEAMLPSALVCVPVLPLTANGKVDRRALAAIEPAAPESASGAPRTPAEELLAGIWVDVLGVPQVGVHDDFFDLGGHSLLATRVISRVRAELRVELPLRRLFEAPTVAGLAAAVEEALLGGVRAAVPPLAPVPRAEGLPLSFAQQRLWFLDQLDPGSTAYNIPSAFTLYGPADVRALAGAYSEILRRHEALRTTFPMVAGQPLQQIAPPAAVAVPVVDLAGLAAERRHAVAERLIADEARRSFDLARHPLVRLAMLRIGRDEHLAILVMHHIVADGWSIGVMVRELTTLYTASLLGTPSPLPELPVQYADYAVWQRGWLQGEVLQAELGWWREQLADAPPLLTLPLDRPRPAVASRRGRTRSLRLPADLASALARLGRQQGVTLFMILLAAWNALLLRLSGEGDLVVGTPIANRHRPGTEDLIGFFVNTLALRSRLAGEDPFAHLLARVRESTLEAYAHQDLPFEKLVEEIAPERSLAHTPLFQIMLALQNAPAGTLDLPGLRLEPLRVEPASAKFDLMLSFAESDEGLHGSLLYATDLFEATTIDRMLAAFVRLLEGAAAAPELPVGDLLLLSAAESHQLSVEWNDTRRADPGDVTLHRLFAAQVERSPEAPALTCAGQTLTYRELDRRANRLARRLRGLGVGPEVVVGVLCERSPDMVVALLAILAAGGAYLPLSPEQPEERLIHLLGEVAAPVLVTEERLALRLPAYGGARLLMDVDEPREEPERPLEGGSGAGNLAYVIYTSGSTGWPKGVAIEHRSAVALVTWAAEVFPREDLRGVLASTAIYFDLSVFELFVTLSRGGRVFLVDDVLALATLDTGGELTLVNTVPSALAELLRLGALPVSVRTVNLAGERLKSSLVRQLYGSGSVRRVFNLYGPSEDTTYSTFARINPDDDVPPIGAPVAGTRVRLLDRRLLPVPVGAVGEICLAGAGLARGYFGQPGLTADRFLPDPFSDRPGARMYRTGDLARYRTSGALEYLGRVDHQVKLRGFRIELGEIEAVLQRHPRVRQAVAAVRSDREDDPRLTVYVVPEPWDGGETAAGPALADDLRRYLEDHLPPYMIPSAVTLLGSLPLTPTGKVDRKALPEPGRGEHAGISIAPRTPVERVLAEIWCEILGRERVGVTESFFALGGHSLLAVRILFRIRQAFGADLPLRALFEETTIARLASRLESADREGRAAAAPLVPRAAGWSPLSFAQERLWLLHQLEPHSAAYNLPLAVRLTGSLDPAALAGALLALIARHEPLRTTFSVRAERPVQVVGAPAPLLLPWVDLTRLHPDLREAEARRLIAREAARPFDLSRGPILRALLLGLGSGEYQALLTLHHIAGDGWSLEILVREWVALYWSASSGISSQLPPLPVRYCDYVAWQRSEARGPLFAEQLAWWARQLAGAPAALDLPMEHPRPAVQTSRGAAVERLLSRELCRRIEGMCRDQGATPFMLLLTALAALLHRYTGQDDLVAGTLIAGRTRAETEGLIGIFLNTLALRITLSGDPTARELLDRVRDTVLGAFDHQDVPFERLLEEIRPERDLSRTPLFQIVLNWLGFGAGGERVELPELTVEPLPAARPIAKFDLEVYASLRSEQIHLRAVYNRDLFAPAQIDGLLAHLEELLAGMAAQPERRLYELPLARIPGEDRCSPVENAISGSPRTALDPSIPERFAAQAAAHAGRPAIVARGEIWTYAELAREVDRVAHALLALRGIREERVALLFSPGAPMVAAVLGTLAAGRTYVPLDPSYPRERLLDMVADSAAKVLLAGDDQRRLAGELAPSLPVLLFGEPPPAPPQWTPPPVPPEALAYLLYTSGSTGRPKGVMQSHGNVLGHIRNYGERLDIVPGDRLALLASYSFDAAVMDIFGALLHGAALCLWDLKTESMDGFAAWLAKHEITLYHSTPTIYRHVFGSLRDGAGCPSLRAVVLGGEEARRSDRELFLRTSPPGCRLINGLGPTESTLALQHVLDQATEVRRPSLPIGRPVPETEVLVRTPAGMQPAVWGVGEIQICSPYLAPGYWRRPDLTAERFVPDPLGKVPGRRLYRTGDLARRLPGGELEFLGRIDDQVKIRGVRIEPAEVEVALASHPRVREAVVVVRETAGERRMVAYVAAPGGPAPEPEGLRLFLRERLPEPMIPATFVVLEALPLTPTGKVDRRSLPVPEEPAGAASAAPATPVEEILVGLWAEVLGVDPSGMEDSFFDLGGHSLLVTRLLSRVRTAFDVDLPFRSIFEHPTAGGLARVIDQERLQARGLRIPPLEPAADGQEAPLSYAQQRLWFMSQLEPESAFYNVPTLVEICGELDIGCVSRALAEIVRRHGSLRTLFASRDRKPVQIVLPARPLSVPVIDLRAVPVLAREEEARRLASEDARRPFDLDRKPAWRCRLLQLEERRHVMVLVLHHIITDGWSNTLLVRELVQLYQAFAEGRPSPLAELPVQYTDFARWQRQWLQGEVLEAQLAYWRGRLAGAPAAIGLALDHPRPAVQSFRGSRQSFEIPAEVCWRLEEMARREGCTLFMLLLSCFDVLLHHASGDEDIVVGSPFNYRSWRNVEGLIGFFVNTLLLRSDLSGDPTFRELLARVRGETLEAFAHEHVPFQKLVEELRPERVLAHNPLFQVGFTYQIAANEEVAISGLTLRPFSLEADTTQFDLNLTLRRTSQGLLGALQYSRDLFDESTISRMVEQLRLLLERVSAASGLRLRELRALLAEADERRWGMVRRELVQKKRQSFQSRKRQAVIVGPEDQP